MSEIPPRPVVDLQDDEEFIAQSAATTTSNNNNNDQEQQNAADGEQQRESENNGDEQKSAPQQQRPKVNTSILGNLVQQTLVANLPPGQRPLPEWKRKQLEKEALARGETIPPEGIEAAAGLYRPPHQRIPIPPTPLISQQAQERSAFPGDFWFHKEIESLISKHRRRVHVKENEDEQFYDRGGKAGRGIIASYVVDGFPLVRNARPKHVRQMMEAGDVYPDNAVVPIITRPGFNGVPNANGAGGEDEDEDDDFSQEKPHDVQIGGGIDE